MRKSKYHEPDDDYKPPAHLKRAASKSRELRKKTRRDWSRDEFAYLDEDSQARSNHVNLLADDSDEDDTDDKDDGEHQTRSQASDPSLGTSTQSKDEKLIAMLSNHFNSQTEELKLQTERMLRMNDEAESMRTTIKRLEEEALKAKSDVQEEKQKAANEKMEMNHVILRAPPLMDRYSTFQRNNIGGYHFESISAYFMNNLRGHRKNPGEPHCAVPTMKILCIESVRNPRLWNKYVAERDDIYGLCNGIPNSLNSLENFTFEHGHPLVASSTLTYLNELFLFHGAPHGLVDRIARQGFDERYAGEHFGALFGKGVYFAHNASKSDIYTTPNADGVRAIFLSRVCLGEIQVVNSAQRNIWKPMERPDGRGPYNSVVANTQAQNGCVEYNEYIIYKGAQAYPEYIIFYKHELGCGCTHCKK
jgi:hypothetical protein